MLAGLMSRCITPRRVHPRDRPGQRHRQPDQLVDGQRRRQPGQRSVAGVGQHDRPRVPRRRPPAAPPRRRHAAAPACASLVAQPAVRVRPQRLLADDGPPGEDQPRDPRPGALCAPFRPERAGLGPARAHLTPSDTSAYCPCLRLPACSRKYLVAMTAGGRRVDAASAVSSFAAAVRSHALPAADDGRGPQASAHHEDCEEPSSGCLGGLRSVRGG